MWIFTILILSVICSVDTILSDLQNTTGSWRSNSADLFQTLPKMELLSVPVLSAKDSCGTPSECRMLR